MWRENPLCVMVAAGETFVPASCYLPCFPLWKNVEVALPLCPPSFPQGLPHSTQGIATKCQHWVGGRSKFHYSLLTSAHATSITSSALTSTKGNVALYGDHVYMGPHSTIHLGQQEPDVSLHAPAQLSAWHAAYHPVAICGKHRDRDKEKCPVSSDWNFRWFFPLTFFNDVWLPFR